MKGAKYVREDKECYKVLSLVPLGCVCRFWTKLRWARYLCALTLLLALTPSYALAASYQQGLAGVIQGPSQWYDYGDPADGGYVGYFVYAYSDFDAALYTLNHNSSQLTSEQKAKLSNASTGGKFYEYVQLFHTFGNDEPGGWLSRDFYGQWVTLYGRDYLYWVEATQQQIDAAKTDLQKVMNGEDLGGGGSGSGGTTPGNRIYMLSQLVKQWSNGNYISDGSNRYTFTKPEDSQTAYADMILMPYSFYIDVGDSLDELDTDGFKELITCTCDSKGTSVLFSIYLLKDGTYTINETTSNLNTPLYNTIMFNKAGSYKYHFSAKYTFDGSIITITDLPNITLSRFSAVSSGTWGLLGQGGGYCGSWVGDTGEPVLPPTNWPTDPTPTPVEPPEVPEPPTTTPPTQPTPPTSPTPPTYQPQPVYVTSNFTVDLQGILDAMDEHCRHIQNALYQNSKNLYEDFATYLSDKYADLKLVLDGNFGYIGDTIDDGFEDLKNYLWDLFKWLKRNMDFTFTAPEYDDSSVLSWLKKIYSKMGTGIRSKPVDPVVDPVGAWDWLAQLIQGILGALSNAVGGLAGTVGELFEGIKDKFPFSIPWDLVAILALFDAAPVTPQAIVDYTIFANGPVAIPVHWDINMHYLDDTMGTVRAMEDIVFCFYLLLKTDWLSNIFDGIGDYLGGKFRVSMRS